eukprot:85046-Chlamydomonas_euryale.AAC.1
MGRLQYRPLTHGEAALPTIPCIGRLPYRPFPTQLLFRSLPRSLHRGRGMRCKEPFQSAKCDVPKAKCDAFRSVTLLPLDPLQNLP